MSQGPHLALQFLLWPAWGTSRVPSGIFMPVSTPCPLSPPPPSLLPLPLRVPLLENGAHPHQLRAKWSPRRQGTAVQPRLAEPRVTKGGRAPRGSGAAKLGWRPRDGRSLDPDPWRLHRPRQDTWSTCELPGRGAGPAGPDQTAPTVPSISLRPSCQPLTRWVWGLRHACPGYPASPYSSGRS